MIGQTKSKKPVDHQIKSKQISHKINFSIKVKIMSVKSKSLYPIFPAPTVRTNGDYKKFVRYFQLCRINSLSG